MNAREHFKERSITRIILFFPTFGSNKSNLTDIYNVMYKDWIGNVLMDRDEVLHMINISDIYINSNDG